MSPEHFLQFANLFPEALVLVSGDGEGFSEGFDALTSANTGLEFLESLAGWDPRGTTLYRNRAEGGASGTVELPVNEAFLEEYRG